MFFMYLTSAVPSFYGSFDLPDTASLSFMNALPAAAQTRPEKGLR